jgi:hypothetical protein
MIAQDIKRVALLAESGGARYPTEPVYAFKGRHAFELHSKLISLRDGWDSRISEAEKDKSFLVVAIQTTTTGLTKRLKIDFYCGKVFVPSGMSYSKGTRWLKLLNNEPNNLL